jgi:hypothetical protein
LAILTGISLTPSAVGKWRRKLRETRKRTTPNYAEGLTPLAQERKREFLAAHDPRTGTIAWNEIMATDEKGWSSNVIRDWRYSLVWQEPPRRGVRQQQGSSYRKNNTRVHTIRQKLGKWRLNLILSISLHPRFPVVHWSLHKGTTTAALSAVRAKRSTPRGIHYDLLDRAKIHTAEKALIQKGLPTIKQALAKKGLQQNLLPNGYPEYQPVEQAFNFVASYVKKKANTFILRSVSVFLSSAGDFHFWQPISWLHNLSLLELSASLSICHLLAVKAYDSCSKYDPSSWTFVILYRQRRVTFLLFLSSFLSSFLPFLSFLFFFSSSFFLFSYELELMQVKKKKNCKFH